MGNSKNTLNSSKLNDTIDKIVAEVFDEKVWIWMDLRKICEITYGYIEWEQIKLKWKNIVINNEVFINIWWLDIEFFKIADDEIKIKLLKEAYENFLKVISEKKIQIEKAIKELEVIDIKEEGLQSMYKRLILIWALREKLLLLEYNELWAIYELEKAWIDINLNKDEIKNIDGRLSEIDKEVFWWKIIDNPDEVSIVHGRIYEILEKSSERISESEKRRMNKYLDRLSKYLDKWYKKSESKKPKNILEKLKSEKIEASDYLVWFNSFIKSYEVMDFEVKLNPSLKSISDWPKWFEIPDNEDFREIDIARFLNLNIHENDTHNVTEHNWRLLLWSIRWAWSTEKDEWLAILMENMLKFWNQIFKTDPKTWLSIIDEEMVQFNNNFIYIAFSEILDDNELMDFLEIMDKCEKDIISPKNRFLRLKRMNKSWWQKKDCSYTRWLFKAIKLINQNILSRWKSGVSFDDMFLAKVWFDEIRMIKEIKEKNNIETISPMFWSDMLIYNLFTRKNKDEDFDFSWFYKYLENKYPILKVNNLKIKSIKLNVSESIKKLTNIVHRDSFDTMRSIVNNIENILKKEPTSC